MADIQKYKLHYMFIPNSIMVDILTLRIQVCPKKWITPTFLFCSDGIGTQNILL